MPLYEFRCRNCGNTEHRTSRSQPTCVMCGPDGTLMKRVYGFNMASVWQEHYNESVGEVISDEKQFKNALRRKGEEATERTGIPHSFVPAEGDAKSMGVSDEGMARMNGDLE